MGLAGVGAVAVAATLCLTGCANVGYYWQSVTGHLNIMAAAKPIDELLQEPQTSERLRERLKLAQRIRRYAVTELHLPDNASYHRYADLHRTAALWNVTAAPAYSLELKTWCFPVTGCVGYRGYYDEKRARVDAADLAQQGYETNVYPVTAYSTLGFMNWAGGDPLLNTFIGYPEGELARLVFHELAHQVIYAKNDTTFNESFATAVERLGGERWLRTQADDKARQEYAAYDGRRRAFRELSRRTREDLKALYETPGMAPDAKEAAKQQRMAQFREEYERMKAGHGGEERVWRGYDRWVREANNAFFGAQAAYDELVPGFEALFHANGDDWPRFYDAARQLAALPKEERHQKLKEAAGG
ncbi:aminopeptidase [Ramlibacter sp. USB13]|uniref:Aminopeptidase n=1 Tax=Ramlibacter cellulosilyticus TaxID=2764187 RepID=A0A923MUL4_9BURK|nr:aminopeptidase [Ramlibacter cellulosilyticus]MBC5784474.1 aminopeptidase [Ramlibacter cellulosilyticus]